VKTSGRQGVQIVAMSATLVNLKELATFLRADFLTEKYRLVELRKFVKVGRDKMEVKAGEGEQFKICRKVSEDDLMVKVSNIRWESLA
jgi:replicative superfamily II helicase